MPAIVVELEDWKMDVRVKSAQLMCVTVQHAENLITQHLEKTLPALYRACGDSDARVSDNVGTFCTPPYSEEFLDTRFMLLATKFKPISNLD